MPLSGCLKELCAMVAGGAIAYAVADAWTNNVRGKFIVSVITAMGVVIAFIVVNRTSPRTKRER